MIDSLQLPVGRFVSGSLTDKRITDHNGKPQLDESKHRFEFGIAVDKNNPALPAIFGALHAEAMTQHAGHPSVANFTLAGYSWKVTDGDKPNRDGNVNANTAGHFVFWFSTSYAPNTCDQNNVQCDPKMIERGYFVDVVFNARNNGASGDQAGLYLNPEWVRFIAYGEKIATGRSAEQAFGAPAPMGALPPGASATPLAGQPAPGVAPTPGNAAPAAVQPATNHAAPAPATASPTSAPQPAHDLVQNATGQPAAAPAVAGLPGLPS